MTELTTQAGRALLGRAVDHWAGENETTLPWRRDNGKLGERIAAIEAEAAEAALREYDAEVLAPQTLAIRPIIDAEIARRDRITAGDKTAGSMPNAEWDALASLPATNPAAAQEWLRKHDEAVRAEGYENAVSEWGEAIEQRRYKAERDALAAENAALRKWIDRLRGFIAAGERLTPELLDELKELLAATAADRLAALRAAQEHDE